METTNQINEPMDYEDSETIVESPTTSTIYSSNYKGVSWGNEKLLQAQKAIQDNRWNLEAWGILIREAHTKNINDVRPFFEELVANFPTCGRYWKIYIEQEMRSRNFENVEKLFHQCLLKVLHVDLWKLYLGYVKETKVALPNFKEKMAQAYDFALGKIGLDVQSYSIWHDYITFLKGCEAAGTYAQSQKISAVRRIYQRGINNPMIGIEAFWREYVGFEQSLNPVLAEKMRIERHREYVNTRRVAREYEAATRSLNKNIPSIPPTGTAEEAKQIEQWRKYISWEKSNPLQSEDITLYHRRVIFAFEQCLLSLGHHLDIWYEAAQFLEQSSKLLVEKGDVTAAQALSDEAGNMFQEATGTTLKNSMLLYFAHADFEEGRVKYERVHQIYSKVLEIRDIDPTLAYIQYMKFARRAEGIKSARSIFKRAREDNRCSWQIFVAAALMEYYCSKDKNVAFRIFELGLKKYSNNPQYILSYLDHLSHLNEDNNTRNLFEKVLSSGNLEPEKSVEIWNRFLEFESNIGNLKNIEKVEKRRNEVLQKLAEFEGKESAHLVGRYKFLDLYPCSPTELRVIGYNEVTAKTTKTTLQALTGSLLKDGLDDQEIISTPCELPRPDLSQMVPYQPKRNTYPGEHSVPGGTFPLPSVVAHLCTLLPPAICFHGPFVKVDALIDTLITCQIPQVPSVKQREKACNVKNTNPNPNPNPNPNRINRKRTIICEYESDEEETKFVPPLFDVYRQRHLKRYRYE